MSVGGAYNAGLRRGRADSFGTAYLRGFRDGTSRVADGGRAYIVNPSAGYSAPSYDREAEYGTAGYWPFEGVPCYWISRYSYDSNAAYGTAGYSYEDGRYPYYDEARRQAAYYGRYDGGYAPSGLLNVAAAPLVTAQYSVRPAPFGVIAPRAIAPSIGRQERSWPMMAIATRASSNPASPLPGRGSLSYVKASAVDSNKRASSV